MCHAPWHGGEGHAVPVFTNNASDSWLAVSFLGGDGGMVWDTRECSGIIRTLHSCHLW